MPMKQEESDFLCRIEPGTPMGALWRSYWVPVLRSPALEAGGDPHRIRVFGENFAAFRSEDGRVAIVDDACPHRGASLSLGRNEKCGLRCLYHGWVINVEGRVIETPNDPTFAHPERIPVRRVEVHEAGEMIWGWFGQGDPPPFPDLPFNRCTPSTHVRATVGRVKANWLQIIENVFDPLHTSLLHGPGNKENWEGSGHPAANAGSPFYEAPNTPPLQNFPPTDVETEATEYGFRYKINHPYANVGEGQWFDMVLPGWLFIPAPGEGELSDITIFGHTPIDDGNTMLWVISYNEKQPLGRLGNFHADTCTDPDNFIPEAYGPWNDWQQDRQAMRDRRSYTGLGIGLKSNAVFLEDVAMTESMGPLQDRTKEHLCKADAAIAVGRRVYRRAAMAVAAGEPAPGVAFDHASLFVPQPAPAFAE
jgi:phthalate 4,5-dioxygenase oxygenase subunit